MKVSSVERLWTKRFFCVCCICLFTGFAMNMINGILAKYIYAIYGNAAFSGILNGAFAVFAILSRILSGHMSDRYGRMMVIVTGCLIFGVAALAFGIVPLPALLILARGFQGLGYSTATTADYAAGSDILPQSRMNEGIGYIGLGYSVAMAIGPAIALALAAGGNYSLVFYAAAGMCFISVLFALFLGETNSATNRHSRISWKTILQRKALPATITQFFNCFAFAAVNSFIVLYADSKGFSNIALFFTCTAVGMCLTRFFTGRLADQFGPRKVGIPALALNAICFLVLLVSNHVAVFYAAGFFFGMGTGTVNPLLQTMAVTAAAPENRGAANGTYQISNDLANGVGAMFWGLLIDTLGYSAVFVSCAGVTLLSAGLLFCITRNRWTVS